MTTSFVLRDANVLDDSGGFDGPVDVSVADGRIVAVEPNAAAVDGAASIDCSDLWLMPGVFDCHDHLTFCSRDPMELMTTPITRWTLEATRNLARTLQCGVTSVRDAAGADAGIRDSVAHGYAPGPRIQISVVALCETGGHFDGFLPGPGIESSGLRHSRLFRAAALRGGRSRRDAWSGATNHVRKALAIKSRIRSAVQIAREHGVRIALGTDFVARDRHGRNLEELVLMHEAGLSAAETLLAATIGGAELCGVGDRYGRIAPGYIFDAIVLDDDPSDISIFSRPGSVTGVFKGDAMVVEHPRFADLLGGVSQSPAAPVEVPA